MVKRTYAMHKLLILIGMMTLKIDTHLACQGQVLVTKEVAVISYVRAARNEIFHFIRSSHRQSDNLNTLGMSRKIVVGVEGSENLW